jgi:hypothetical protein
MILLLFHANMTAPLPVRSAKLSMFGPGQYYGGGPGVVLCQLTEFQLSLMPTNGIDTGRKFGKVLRTPDRLSIFCVKSGT